MSSKNNDLHLFIDAARLDQNKTLFPFLAESRLEKIRSDPNLLRQLTEKREACMRQLMREDSFHEYSEETWRFEEPVEDSPVLRVVAPHKQALTLGETVQFLHYDQLGSESEEVAKREE